METGTQAISIQSLRKRSFARVMGTLTLSIFLFVFYIAPAGNAMAEASSGTGPSDTRIDSLLEKTPDSRFGARMERLREAVVHELPRSIEERRVQRGWYERARGLFIAPDALTSDEIRNLRGLREGLADAYREVYDEFDRDEQRFRSMEMAPDVRRLVEERYREARARFTTSHAATQAQLQDVLDARGTRQQERLEILKSTLESESFERRHTPLDPDRLPWGTPDSNVREPITDPKELEDLLGARSLKRYPLLASAEPFPGILAQALPSSGFPTHDDLAETVEVQMTDEIRALAESLNNDPVEIYTWVRNNIHFIPSYGSIQGAQHTLETRSGNATDTASLLISLLRAAGIPARYAYGTVDVPVDKAMNWVGGVETPAAAANLMGQGGIPVVLMMQGGTATHIRIEHVWVQAWVDYFPSRGMKHREGDSWIPLDASFKQYEYTEGMDLQENVPFDAESLIALIEGTAIINEEEGWIQNIPADDIDQQLDLYQQQVEDYINQQNPEATLGDVLGMQDIKVIVPRPLAAGLPYRHIATAESFSEVPESLRHRFKYELATLFQGIPLDTIIAIDEPTVKLAGKTLALSFRPATEEDEAIIMAYLPQPDPETGEIDPSLLPDRLPGYLINMTAEFTIDGVVVAESDAGAMGAELHETMGLWKPGNLWNTSTNFPAIGEYRAIGLDLQGGNPEQAARLQENIERTREALESMDETQLASLTRHDVVGDLFYATIFSYFALNSVQDQIAARGSGIVTYRAPSYGLFGTSLQTHYLYGVPRYVKFGGLVMDVDHMSSQVVSTTNDDEQRRSFVQTVGARSSAMEHLVPEMMFSTDESPGHGISAVKALALAAEEGQRIWTITADNLDLALENIDLSAKAKTDIRNAVRTGKVVTAHEARINFHGWIGEGYTVIDPQTGAGAYIISGGMNGGVLLLGLLLITAISVLALSTALIASGGVAAIVVGIIALLVLPIYLAAQAWLATTASGEQRNKWLEVVELVSKGVRHGMGKTGKSILEILDPIIDWLRYEPSAD